MIKHVPFDADNKEKDDRCKSLAELTDQFRLLEKRGIHSESDIQKALHLKTLIDENCHWLQAYADSLFAIDKAMSTGEKSNGKA